MDDMMDFIAKVKDGLIKKSGVVLALLSAMFAVWLFGYIGGKDNTKSKDAINDAKEVQQDSAIDAKLLAKHFNPARATRESLEIERERNKEIYA